MAVAAVRQARPPPCPPAQPVVVVAKPTPPPPKPIPPVEVQDRGALAITAKPIAAIVHPDGAWVTRGHELYLEPGIYRLELKDLPGAVAADSVRARVEGQAKLIDVAYVEREAAGPPKERLTALTRQSRAAQTELDALADEETVLKEREELIKGVSKRLQSTPDSEPDKKGRDPRALQEQYSFIFDERARILEGQRNLRLRRDELQNELGKLEKEREKLSKKAPPIRVATATVELHKAAQVPFELFYRVTDASWSPAYRLRVSRGTDKATLEYDALVKQSTGEDWTGVGLAFPTSLLYPEGAPKPKPAEGSRSTLPST